MANIIHTMLGMAEVSVEASRDEIRRMLVERQCQLRHDIRSKIRDVREEGFGKDHQAMDPGEPAEDDPQDDLAFALIQMRAQVLNRIDEAVRRLDEGTYGYCVDCADAIARSRLRALPFAVRCRDCEEMREHPDLGERVYRRRMSSGLSFDMRP